MLQESFAGSVNIVLEAESIIHYFVQVEVKSLFYWHVFLNTIRSG